MTITWEHLRLLLVIGALLLLPGWAFLSVSGLWRRFEALQRWIVATGFSIAFFPVLYYFLRLIPGFRMGVNKLLVLLALCLGLIIWKQWKTWKEQIKLDGLSWLAVAVIIATLFTRLVVAVQQPYPAWSDSLHHTLLTQLAASSGRLPVNLEPYAPTPLDMYHLGLYALTAPAMVLAKVSAHSALLWVVQVLNGLCGLGIFLVLDRKVGRIGAVVGAVVVGLLSMQPAWYVNWGRFTQVASQSILLIAALVSWEVLSAWRSGWADKTQRIALAAFLFLAGLMNAGVFLLHFRVAGYYLPLIGVIFIVEFIYALKNRQVKPCLFGVACLSLLTLAMISPVLIQAGGVYLARRLSMDVSAFTSNTQYYEVDQQVFTLIGASVALYIAAGVGALIALMKRQSPALIILLWTGLMLLLGLLFKLGVPWLAFTNFSAIVIALYLPIALLVGSGAQALAEWLNLTVHLRLQQILLGVVCLLGFGGAYFRITGIEPVRYFVDAKDVDAMNWVAQNTPAGALFGINTYMWMGSAPHGTDGGYWLPYFTGRHTNTSTMLFSLDAMEERTWLRNASEIIRALSDAPVEANLKPLCEMDMDFLYTTTAYDMFGARLNADALLQLPGVQLVYQNDKVRILQICSD